MEPNLGDLKKLKLIVVYGEDCEVGGGAERIVVCTGRIVVEYGEHCEVQGGGGVGAVPKA